MRAKKPPVARPDEARTFSGNEPGCIPARVVLNHFGAAVTLFLMTLPLVIALGVFALSDPISVTEPVYPPGALAGGTVVAALHITAGSVTQIEILAGEEPFTSSARDALRSWRFEPRQRAERIPVVINFRNPNLFAVGPTVQNPPASRKSHSTADLPFPERIVESVYPANSLGQGSVILGLEIDAAGGVSRVNAIRSLGGLTAPCTNAVRAWIFAPARDQSGRKARSQAFAVCVFRQPVL